jgi:nitrite reductase (NADH) small subunit
MMGKKVSVKIGAAAEIKSAGRMMCSVQGVEIGIFAVDDELKGWRNECPHQSGPVCQGRVFRRVLENINDEQKSSGRIHHPSDINIVCPWHGIEFDIRTGKFPGNPKFALTPVDVELLDGDVYVRV